MVVAHTVKSSAQVPFDILTSQSLHHAANPKRTDGEQKQNEKLYLDFIKRSTILETPVRFWGILISPKSTILQYRLSPPRQTNRSAQPSTLFSLMPTREQ